MAGGCGTTGGWAVRSRALPGERAWLLPLGSADGRSDGMSVRSDRTGATSGGNGRSLLLGRLYRRGSTITTRPPAAFRAPPNGCALGLTSTLVRRCLVTLHLLAQPSTCTWSRLIPGVNDSGRRFFSITTKISRRDPRPCPHEYHPPIVYTPSSTRCSPPVTTWRPT